MRILLALAFLLLTAPAFALEANIEANIKDLKVKEGVTLPVHVPEMSFAGVAGTSGDVFVPAMSFTGIDGASGDIFVPAMSFAGVAGANDDIFVPAMSFAGIAGAAGDIFVAAMSFKGAGTPSPWKLDAKAPSAAGLGTLVKPQVRAPAGPQPSTAARPAAPRRPVAPTVRREAPVRAAPEEPAGNYKP